MDWSNITTGSSSASQPMLSLDELKKITDKFRAEERELLRGESLMIEQMECSKCGRKPTVTGRGMADKTYVVCPHIWEAIKKQVPQADPPGRTLEGAVPLGFEVYGVRIEVLDDGPRRW